MGKYENDVKRLLELVGGKKNIQAVSHCMTRMRFVLVDSKKANEEEIEDLPSVKGTFYPGRTVSGHHRERCCRILQ